MIEAGATSTRKYRGSSIRCARPTGGTHDRTTGAPILLISIRFPLENKEAGAPASSAWGLRRTAVVRAPRATSTPPRAAPPQLASYNGTGGGTVARASRARLSTPRQPTPLLSGTCLSSAGRPPLQAMLAMEGPGHPEGYPGPLEARYALSELRRIPRMRT